MLLLSEKNEYDALLVSEGTFYNKYKEKINSKIEKVCIDFNFTDEVISKLIEEKEYTSDDFQYDKIWIIFSKGFNVMHWGLMYRKNFNPEEIFAESYDYEDKLSNKLIYKKV